MERRGDCVSMLLHWALLVYSVIAKTVVTGSGKAKRGGQSKPEASRAQEEEINSVARRLCPVIQERSAYQLVSFYSFFFQFVWVKRVM